MLPVTSLSWEEQGRCEKHNVHNGSALFSVADTVDKNNQSVRRLAPFENERGEAEDTNNCVETTTRLMITAYVFDKSAENIFQFVLVIFLSSVFTNSMLLVSIHGVYTGLLVFFLGGKAGSFFDKGVANNQRLQSTLFALTGKYACTLACCAVCFALLKVDKDGAAISNHDPLAYFILVLIVILSGFAKLLSDACTMSIEKDWLVVINDNNIMSLGSVNAKLQRVDLICSMIAPLAAGYCLEGSSNKLELVFIVIGAIALFAYIVKYKCLQCICAMVPALMIAQSGYNASSENGDSKGTVDEHEIPEVEDPRHCYCPLIGAYIVYFQQDISLGGLGISLLYLNVMTMGNMMTSYLIWRNLSLGWIGLVRGANAVSGVVGTFAFSLSSKRYTLRTTTLLSIGYMTACLLVSFIGTVFISNDAMSLTMLVVGVVVSRVGLHSSDLAICQLSQQSVPENVRGTVSGSQHSMNSFFLILQFGSGIIWADPSQFYILCSIGYLAVIAAFFLMLRGVYLSAAFQDITIRQ